MPEHDHTIVVMIDPQTEPIAGTVGLGDGDRASFVGYAHLVAEIERHRDLSCESDAAGGPDRSDRTPSEPPSG